jgi:hypothetical protein
MSGAVAVKLESLVYWQAQLCVQGKLEQVVSQQPGREERHLHIFDFARGGVEPRYYFISELLGFLFRIGRHLLIYRISAP